MGVGHWTWLGNESPGRVAPLWSRAIGVRHIRIASVSVVPGCITPVVVVPLAALAASVVTGVGQLRDEEESFSPVGRADVLGRDDSTKDAITELLEPTDNDVHPSCNKRRHVFNDDEPRPDLFDDAPVLEPQPGSFTVEAGAVAGDADVLARESSANKVNVREVVAADRFDICEPLGVREVHGEHAPRERIDLDLPHDGPDASPRQAEFNPADPGEDAPHDHELNP